MSSGPHVKYLLFLSDFDKTFISPADLSKNHPVGAELFHADI